jgi:hypothetical protein
VSKPDDPKIDLVLEAIRDEVNRLRAKSDLSSVDRSSMSELAAALSAGEDDFEVARLEWLLLFLSGDVDWRKQFKKTFGREPAKKSVSLSRSDFPKPKFRTLREMP